MPRASKWLKRVKIGALAQANRPVLHFQPMRYMQLLHAASLGADAVFAAHAGAGENFVRWHACPLRRCSHEARRWLIEPLGQVRSHVAHAAQLASHQLTLTPDPSSAPAHVFATCNRSGAALAGHREARALAAHGSFELQVRDNSPLDACRARNLFRKCMKGSDARMWMGGIKLRSRASEALTALPSPMFVLCV